MKPESLEYAVKRLAGLYTNDDGQSSDGSLSASTAAYQEECEELGVDVNRFKLACSFYGKYVYEGVDADSGFADYVWNVYQKLENKSLIKVHGMLERLRLLIKDKGIADKDLKSASEESANVEKMIAVVKKNLRQVII